MRVIWEWSDFVIRRLANFHPNPRLKSLDKGMVFVPFETVHFGKLATTKLGRLSQDGGPKNAFGSAIASGSA